MNNHLPWQSEAIQRHSWLPFLKTPFLLGKHKLESSGLPRGCLLYKTLQAQMLDMLDIEGLYPLYNRVEQYLEEFPEER